MIPRAYSGKGYCQTRKTRRQSDHGILIQRLFVPMAPVLDISGLWSAGDDYKVIKALGLPFGTYTQDCVISCMNDLQGMSVVAQQDVIDLLADYDAAETAQSAQNLSNTEGKVLVEADVLRWVVANSGMTGPQSEKLRVKDELAQIFSFCTCIAGYLGGQGYGTPLIRS